MPDETNAERQLKRNAPLFQIQEVKVMGGVRKGAIGTVGDTIISIQPNQAGLDDLEVAFYKKEKPIGEPIRINAGQEDLVEVADTLTRHLANGVKPQELLRYLEETQDFNAEQMAEELRAKFKTDFGTGS